MKKSVLIISASLGVGLAGLAVAQTPLATRTKPALDSNQRIQNGEQAMEQIKVAPIPQEILEQAAKQRSGDYGKLNRPAIASGQIQKAWDKAGNEQGVFVREECEACVYQVRLREFMSTAIQLPDNAIITKADLGDQSMFTLQTRSANTLAVMPKASGVDSSLTVYTEDNRVFTFYLRGEGVNSKNIPDLLYRITARREARPSFVSFFGKNQDGSTANPEDLSALASQANTDPAQNPAGKEDYVKTITFDPAKLRGWGDYKLWGDKELKPEIVYRDDYFTYIKYGERLSEVDLPTAYVVNDQYDELVNSRLVGDTYIIESTKRLITLKSGKKYMCIEYKGDR